jgi:uncharacterized membrane protein YcaP (DUF421 family)
MDLDFLHAFIGSDEGDISWWLMSIRAVLIFLYGVALVRMAGKRVFGKWGAIDIILSVIIGSNLSRALTGSAPFVETLVATTALVALHWVLTLAATRAQFLGPLLKGHAARVCVGGEIDRDELKRHGVGEHDLEAAFRNAGVKDPDEVDEIWIERNGDVNVLKRNR